MLRGMVVPWNIETVDNSLTDVGEFNSLALDSSGYPYISYYDAINNHLKYAVGKPGKPVASFSSTPTTATVPMTVQFTDTSTNAPTSWFWNFGDGNTSTERNPTHTFMSIGRFTVSLTATNALGSDVTTKTNLISVLQAAPDLVWEKSLGGSARDYGNSIIQTADGGYIVAGGSRSTDGDVSGNHGGWDYWIVKLDSTGTITWQKSLGGSSDDIATSITQTADGGYIVAGYSSSNNGDVSGNHGGSDYWIVKLDSTGTITWQKSLGGSANDKANSIAQTSDGGYIVGGYSDSTNGDVTGHHGNGDYWIVKLDSTGTISWQKSLGGSGEDEATSIVQTSDGGYIVAGTSSSTDGDVSGNHGGNDYWIVKLDASGGITWQKSLGESANDYGSSIIQTADGGYIVAGYSYSDEEGYSEMIIKLDSSGTITWQNSLEASQAFSIAQTSDGGYIIAGESESTENIVSGNHGGWDYWIVKLDSTGTTTWLKSFGGSSNDIANSIVQTSDSRYIVAGCADSTDGDVSGSHGSGDYWIVKLDSDEVPAPVASFTATPTSGTAPLDVTFTDHSDVTDGTMWNWSFGDSTWYNDTASSNPVHTYSSPGTYTVSLKVTNASGSNTATRTGYITVTSGSGGSAPVAAFSVTPTSGTAPLDVSFTDTSTGSPTAWNWSFGDGSYSEDQNPVHTYDDIGSYTVSLTATNAVGSDTVTETDFISVLQPTPVSTWQTSLGGDGNDKATSIVQTDDGGYIVAGYSDSNDGDVSGNHGNIDYWVVKLDASGGITWQKSLGGSGNDEATSIVQTDDGGYIVAGESNSNDGEVSGNHGGYDYWVVKLDASGGISWQKSLGGSSYDSANSIIQTSDGGYIVAGTSSSTDGEVSGNHGGNDYWIVKLDADGGISWQKSLGGSNHERAYSIVQTTDGGYVVAGESSSNDGEVSGNHGGYDYWVVKLDASGGISWQKSLGGSSYDSANSIIQTSDGGYIVAGQAYSNNGNVSGNQGNADYWVVKLDASGGISWQKSLGGTADDFAYSIFQTTDGGYIVAGYSNSNNRDVSGNHGNNDYWIVKLDVDGGISWQKSLGGTADDFAYSIFQTTDGGYIVAGQAYSNDGDVSGNHGSDDYWIARLDKDGSSTPVTGFTATPTHGTAPLTVTFTDSSDVIDGTLWNWSFGDGSWTNTTDNSDQIHTYSPEGTYDVTLTVTNGSGNNRVTKNGYIHVTNESSEGNAVSFRFDARHTGVYNPVAGTTGNTGTLLWSYSTGGQVRSSPAVADGVLYVGSYDNYVYALNATSGDVLWSILTAGGSGVGSSPAIANGVVYVQDTVSKYTFYALNAATGAIRWNTHSDIDGYSSPAISNGAVYVGTEGGNVYALDTTTGTQIWSYDTGREVESSPAVTNGIVYVGSDDDKIYALNTTSGDLLWSYSTGGQVTSSPAVANGIVYVGSDDDKIYALNTTSGDFLWSYPTGGQVESSPAVANGVVYVGSDDDKIYALNTTSGDFLWSYPTGGQVESSPAVS